MREIYQCREKVNRDLHSSASHVTSKLPVPYKRHDSDDEVGCYRRTEGTLTHLEEGGNERGNSETKVRERQREE